ncbi:MAG: aminotransferase class I/II-fold pyridoxal phosphate-dependent enzyme [Vampirovibrionales bacterium]|nr:aminotransferase class I/II-fold pyridoxal phosphate-dependent enzyme [Vampirovibrionales bacterium]
MTRGFSSLKADAFSESVIREMSRLASAHGAINLAQGFPDFPCPEELKRAAAQALYEDVNQYAVTWGAADFREAIAAHYRPRLGMPIDPHTELTVTCGATEAMAAAMIATVNPGDEVIVFEPYYENYGPDAILCGAIPRFVTLHAPDWHFDPTALKAAFNDRTRAIVINTPNNPTGKVFTREELALIAECCQQWGVLCITDEIYEYILYDGAEHVSMRSLPGMAPLTIAINALSKTYSVTGWRVGWLLADAPTTAAIRKVHDFLTVGAPAPLQRAGVTALSLPPSYFDQLASDYNAKRNAMMAILDDVGIPYFRPQGAYYLFADIASLGFSDDIAFARHLVESVGVAVVPGSSFFHHKPDGARYVRFCFSKTPQTLTAAHQRLRSWAQGMA